MIPCNEYCNSKTMEPRQSRPAKNRDARRADGHEADAIETPSLPEVFSTIGVPVDAPRWRKLLAFVAPGLLVAVGYMDPGNWATNLAGGARFGDLLISVILISNFMAMLLQFLSLQLSIVTGPSRTRHIFELLISFHQLIDNRRINLRLLLPFYSLYWLFRLGHFHLLSRYGRSYG